MDSERQQEEPRTPEKRPKFPPTQNALHAKWGYNFEADTPIPSNPHYEWTLVTQNEYIPEVYRRPYKSKKPHTGRTIRLPADSTRRRLDFSNL